MQSIDNNEEKITTHPFSSVKHVLAVIGGKGGVGKSTVCATLAVTMQRRGFSCGILDADLTGPSIPKMFGLNEYAVGDNDGIFPVMTKFGLQIMSMDLLLENHTDPVVWRGGVLSEYVKKMFSKTIWTDLDYLFIDMPPGTGDIPITVFPSLPVDGAIVVITPQSLTNLIATKCCEQAVKSEIPILGVIENQAYFICSKCGKKHNLFGETNMRFAEKFNVKLRAEIPIDKDIPSQEDKGLIELFDGDYLEEFCEELEKCFENEAKFSEETAD